MESLMAVKSNSCCDPAKGKLAIVLDGAIKHTSAAVGALPTWSRPVNGWVKLNTDGSFVSSEIAGAGMILRDSDGKIIFSACRALFSCRDALEAELCACMEGISYALHRSDLPIAVELDSLVAVSMITCDGCDRSAYAFLVKEIRYLLSLRQSCITHVSRSQNKASDSLAAFGRAQGRTMTWIGSAPPDVLELVAMDCTDIN
jgi:ribonuclease HI